MAMAGVGCRAPSAILARPVAFIRLFPCCGVLDRTSNVQFSLTSSSASASASKDSWKAASQRMFGQTSLLRLGLDGRATVVARRLQHRFFVKAIDVSGPGSVDSPLMQSMQTKIKDDLNAESVTVKDAYGDGRHVSIYVVASVFEGKSAVNRQRMVYKAIWDELQGAVHAVDQLKTHTPSEAANLPDQL